MKINTKKLMLAGRINCRHVLAALVLSQAAQGQTLVNGNFDASHTWVNPTGGQGDYIRWSNNTVNTTFINGWSVTGSGAPTFATYDWYWHTGVATVWGAPASPQGGGFVWVTYNSTSSIYQTVTGLTPGAQYQVSFYQNGYALDNDYWMVSLGTETHNSASMTSSTPTSNTMAGWSLQTLTFTATSASEVLKFVATPMGHPQTLQLDGITMTKIPEPSTSSLAIVSATVFGLVMRRRKH